MLSGLCFTQDGSKSTDLVAECCTYVLRAVRAQIFDGGQNVAEKNLSVDKLTEACVVKVSLASLHWKQDFVWMMQNFTYQEFDQQLRFEPRPLRP
jgi:hypothetical protein